MQTVFEKTRADVMMQGNTPVLTYTINYPYFTTTCNPYACWNINCYYEIQADSNERYCRTELFPQAAQNGMYADYKQFPFRSYEFLSNYEITYNKNCMVSLFTEDYSYLGGAHGSTIRQSQTWDFQSGKQLKLNDFFSCKDSFTKYIFNEIDRQIIERLKKSPSSYFDDYPKLLRGNFNVNGFYLRPDGIVIYYQQYDIAPYVTGIPEFFIPFEPCFHESPITNA